jgi:23S rRNA (cytosine1962-C5)-methyltransferase
MEGKYIEFYNRLTKQYTRLSKIARKSDVSCFRIYDLDLPDFPFMIDKFEDFIYVAEYERNHNLTRGEHNFWLDLSKDVIAKVTQLPKDHIYVKSRRNIKNRDDQYTKVESIKKEIIVNEDGLMFKLNLSDYLDTGLFLDHRKTRKLVRSQSQGKSILNLFAYTGSFSVYAAAGGAESIMTLDLSKTYLDWAKENMLLNGFEDDQKYHFVLGDVMVNLDLLKPQSFDIIILDPPSFSNSKRMQSSFDVQRDHWWMINRCIKLLKPEGIIYFSTNLSKFKMYNEKIDSATIKDITNATKDFDFERKLKRYCFTIQKL